MRSIRRAIIIVLAGAALGLVANAVSPRRIPYITPPKAELSTEGTISLPDAQKLWASGVFFLDARAPADYAAGHIANAFNLPWEEFDVYYPHVAPMLTPGMELVVYCNGVECELSHHLADRLKQLGFTNIHILINGWTVWHEAKLPTATGGGE